MKKLSSVLAVAAVVGVTMIPGQAANAWWGGPWGGSPWSNGYGGGPWSGFGDMFGGGDMNFNMKSYGHGNGYGYGNPYMNYAGAYPYYGSPYYGGYPYGGYGIPYGVAPVAPVAPAAPAAPASK